MSAELKPLACPFCGHVGLDFAEGSTFRWIVGSCGGCAATRGETRIQTLGQGTKEEWMAVAQADAIAEWNRRATPAPGAPGQEAAAVDKDSLTTQAAAVQAVGAWQDIAGLIVRAVCESDPADPEHPDTVCVNVNDLAAMIVSGLEDGGE